MRLASIAERFTAGRERERRFGRTGQPAGLDQHQWLNASVFCAAAVYAAAVGGCALLHLRAVVLDAVPLWVGAAALGGCCGRLLCPRAVRTCLLLQAAGLVVVLGLSLACLSYVGAAVDLPLRDHDIIALDRHVGFDWQTAMSGLDRHPHVLAVLDGAYATFTTQLIGTVLILVAARRPRDLERFFITFVCASLIAEIASVLAPTLGPMSVLDGQVHFANLPSIGRATAQVVMSLRSGTLTNIEFEAINGIISFPSMHAAVAVIVPYSLRWNRALFWPVAVLDAVMLVSAVPSGNHYLMDAIGGVVVAVAAITLARGIHGVADRSIIAMRRHRAAMTQLPTGAAWWNVAWHREGAPGVEITPPRPNKRWRWLTAERRLR